ncbi:MAG: hypothetical protein C5B49_11510, partial [Bdellovibrio sp.]
MTNFSSTAIQTNTDSLTIAGTCTVSTGTVVWLGGDANQKVPCNDGSFSFVVAAANDGSYQYSLSQTSRVDHPSDPLPFSWTKSTVKPASPTITSPASTNYKSNGSSLTISGGCLAGGTVKLTGGASLTSTCAADGTYSFALNEAADGTYSFDLTQTDLAGNVSGPTSLSWLRLTTPPAPPTVTNPGANPFTSADTILTISGACVSGNTVSLSGAATDSTACMGGTYSFSVTGSVDQTYDYSLHQTDLVGNTSTATSFQWTRNSALPPTPVLTSPATSLVYNNGNTLVIAGSCGSGNTVVLSGDSTGSLTCAVGTFSFTASETSDGTYSFSVDQQSASNLVSGAATVTWTRDTVAPSAPTVTNPPVNPLISNSPNLTLSGACEVNATVNLSGDATGSTICSAGVYSLSAAEPADGVYNFTLTQTDRAGNTSAAKNFTWTRDTTAPAPPTVTSPAANPFISNGNTITLGGGCETLATVNLTSGTLLVSSTACTGGAYSFSITKSTDGVYSYSLNQTDLAGNVSTSTGFSWTRDTVAPAAPLITNPATNPFSSNGINVAISGICESGATVAYSGAISGSQNCVGATFSLPLAESADGTYNVAISQTDSAGNTSATTGFQWVRNATLPATPTITSPASNPYVSNANSMTLSGSCSTGNAIYLMGSSTQNTLCASSLYSFTVNESTDGTYNFSVYQVDSFGNISPYATLSWQRDTVAPSAPTVTSPSANPYASNGSSVVVSGSCQAGATVNYSGDASGTTPCSGSFSFSINKTTDGTYNVAISQTDSAGNTSSSTSFQWIRSTASPAAPTITAPAGNPYISNTNTVALSGTCVSGDTVSLAGAGTGTTSCASSAYSFNLSKTTDGTFGYSVLQTDSLGNVSPSSAFTWVRNTVVPGAPTVTSPANPFISNGNSVTISGGCQSGTTVNYSNAATGSVACSSAAYSFTVTKTSDGIYTVAISQTDAAGNTSSAASFQWTRNTVPPSAPTISGLLANPYLSNGNSVSIYGGCASGDTVKLSGASTQTVACSSSAYSFSVTKTSDGTYNFSLSQTDSAGNVSASAAFAWTRNTVAPSAPTVTTPAANPFTSADTNLTISGACQAGATINYSNAATGSTSCSSGTYSFVLSESVDGTYTVSLSQTDPFGNTSPTTSFQWTRDTSIPTTPTITSPGASPYNSNGSGLTISGGCTTGDTVQISGSLSNSMVCSSGAYSFSDTKTVDGTYNYSLVQKNLSNISSATASLSWVRNTVAPSAPTVTTTNPLTTNTNPITINGGCQNNATVYLSGASSGSVACSSSVYRFTVFKTTDGTYNFSLSQTDLAGNTSTATSFQWVRNTVPPAAPTLTSPAANPYTSNTSSVNLSGGCLTGATVNLAGASTQAVTCASSAYSFTVNKSVDGTYNMTLTQTDTAGNISPTASFSWVRNTVAPSAPTITSPANPYTSNGNGVVVSGACQSGATVNYANAATGTTSCSSGAYSITLSKTTDGTYTLAVSQTDTAGNTSSSASFQWTRNTVPPSAPTITSPAANPYTSNANSVALSGACLTGATVNLTGASVQAVTCASSSYSFTVSKTSDGTYSMSLSQTDTAGNVSPSTSFSWTRNTVPPSAPTVTSPAANPYTSADT